MSEQRDQQTAEEFTPDLFEGTWNLMEGQNLTGKVVLKRIAFGKYEVSYSGGQHPPQLLYYNAYTRSLDSNKDSKDVDRSIALWQGPGSRRSLYAKYEYKTKVAPNDRLPFEKGDKGTWGAEDG